MEPLLKNHLVLGKVSSPNEFYAIMVGKKSIYFRPLNRVMPTRFFLNELWNSKHQMAYLQNGDFYNVERKDERTIKNIRRMLARCPEIKKN